MNICTAIKGLSLTALLTFPAAGVAGWYNPHLEIYPQCIEPGFLRSSELLKLTREGVLYLVHARPEHDGMDSILSLRHGFKGMIFPGPIFPEDSELETQTIHFTGTMVRRDASILERFIGGSDGDSYYYVVELDAGKYLLRSDSFDNSGFHACRELLNDLD